MAQRFPEADGRRQVLVVEDNPVFIDFLHNNLRKWNYSVVMVRGAQPVLSLVLEQLEKEKFHVLITTSQIQDMDCLEFVRQIRHQEPHLPIIILVCRDEDLKQMSSIMELGGCDFICMPVKMTEELLVRMVVLTIKKININLNEMPVEAGTSTFTAVGEAAASADASPKEKVKDVVDESLPAVKKPRLSWSNELHQRFIDVVNVLGLEASAAKICRNMNVEGLTREQVSSHLQVVVEILHHINEYSIIITLLIFQATCVCYINIVRRRRKGLSDYGSSR